MQGGTSRTAYYINGESALMAEADEESRITRAYGFNPHPQQARANEEDEDAQEGSLCSTDPIWQAELNGKTSLKEAGDRPSGNTSPGAEQGRRDDMESQV